MIFNSQVGKCLLVLLVLGVFTSSGFSQGAQKNPVSLGEQVLEEPQLISSDSIVLLAQSLLGIPYLYGGATPLAGFDCSGFVKYVYGYFGMDLPRTTSEIAGVGVEIPLDSCRQGDIIVFAGRNKETRPIGHVGIITSDLCEPISFIHSATSRNRGIVVSAFDKYDYYKNRLVKVVRLVDKLSY